MKPTSTTSTPTTSDDSPPLSQADFNRARFRVGDQDVSRVEWQSAVRAKLSKQVRKVQ
jgi:hypothetical protein